MTISEVLAEQYMLCPFLGILPQKICKQYDVHKCTFPEHFAQLHMHDSGKKKHHHHKSSPAGDLA